MQHKPQVTTLKLSFAVIAVSAPCSDPHVCHIHCDLVRGASLHLQKNPD